MTGTRPSTPRWRRWGVLALVVLFTLELAWLLAINTVLALPLTQSLLNDLRPDRVQLSWRRARSWYPGRVSLEGVVVSGQTPRIQWQAEADRVRGSVALLPLLQRRVTVSRGDVVNGRYLQRSRPEPGAGSSIHRQDLPAIRGFELTPRTERAPTGKAAWTVDIHDARLSGQHGVWINRLQARLAGSARADLSVRSRGGPLDLTVPDLFFTVERLWADGDEEIVSDGRLEGSYRLGPYRYREHRGLQALRFMDLDVDVDLQSRGLEFVELLLLNYPDLEIAGRGRATGRLALQQGRVAPGTALSVRAENLSVAHDLYRAEGAGTVTASYGEPPLPFAVEFLFDALEGRHVEDDSLFFSGAGLALALADSGDLVPAESAMAPGERPWRARLDLPRATVPDMRTFNRYLPPTSPVTFTSGKAGVELVLALAPQDASGSLRLRGEDLRAALDDQELGLDIAFDGVVAGGRPSEGFFDLAGSRLTLGRARVVGAESRHEEEDWSAAANFRTAELVVARAPDLVLDADLDVTDTRPLTALFRNNGGPDWIARRLEVDDLVGSASVLLRDERFYAQDIRLGDDILEFALRGVVGEPAPEGRAYLRYKRLDALLRLEGDDRGITLFDPRDKFDAYQPPAPPPRVDRRTRSGVSPVPK